MVWLLNVKLGAVQSTYYMVKSYRFKFPNFRIGPCGISSAYRAHFPPLIVRARARIIPCAFPQHIVHISRRLSCAHGPASYRAHSAVDGAEIPQSMVRKFRTIGAFPQHIVRFPLVILRFRT